jgi:hypothetical protein
MMGKHVADCAGALALVGGKHIVELQNSGKERKQSIARGDIFDPANRRVEPREGEELSVIKEIAPGPEFVTQGLTGIVSVLEIECRQQDGAAIAIIPESRRALAVRFLVRCSGGKVFLRSVTGKNQFSIEPKPGPGWQSGD